MKVTVEIEVPNEKHLYEMLGALTSGFSVVHGATVHAINMDVATMRKLVLEVQKGNGPTITEPTNQLDSFRLNGVPLRW